MNNWEKDAHTGCVTVDQRLPSIFTARCDAVLLQTVASPLSGKYRSLSRGVADWKKRSFGPSRLLTQERQFHFKHPGFSFSGTNSGWVTGWTAWRNRWRDYFHVAGLDNFAINSKRTSLQARKEVWEKQWSFSDSKGHLIITIYRFGDVHCPSSFQGRATSVGRPRLSLGFTKKFCLGPWFSAAIFAHKLFADLQNRAVVQFKNNCCRVETQYALDQGPRRGRNWSPLLFCKNKNKLNKK